MTTPNEIILAPLTKTVVPIVEGEGDVQSVNTLLRRLLAKMERYDIEIDKPYRVPRGKMTTSIGGVVQEVINRRKPCHAILILFDADDDLPCELAPRLLERARESVTHIPIFIVLAKREYEAWFLGSLASLLPSVPCYENAEDIRGAKERLASHLPSGKYNERTDQPSLTAKFDMELAWANCPSFDKLLRDIDRLLQAL